MKRIPLTQGKYAVVDDADYGWLAQWKWCVTCSQDRRRWYAVRRSGLTERRPGYILRMHRVIMAAPDGTYIDHRDGDGLNCQRHNLRFATKTENARNSINPRPHKTSLYKGVSRSVGTSLWRATIKTGPDHRRIHLGYFRDEHDAARAYNRAALRLFGQFAAINVIKQEARHDDGSRRKRRR